MSDNALLLWLALCAAAVIMTAIDVLCGKAALVSPWHFWNPGSGAIGGALLAVVLLAAVYLLDSCFDLASL